MPAELKRFYGKGHLHFITFSCYRRLPLLKTAPARDVFVKELSKIRDEMGFRLAGYVVMPEHVHLLISEPKQGTPSSVLQRLKLRVSRSPSDQPRVCGNSKSSFRGTWLASRCFVLELLKNGRKLVVFCVPLL